MNEVSRPACHSPLVTRTPTLSHSSHLIPVRTTRAPPGTSGGSDGRWWDGRAWRKGGYDRRQTVNEGNAGRRKWPTPLHTIGSLRLTSHPFSSCLASLRSPHHFVHFREWAVGGAEGEREEVEEVRGEYTVFCWHPSHWCRRFIMEILAG